MKQLETCAKPGTIEAEGHITQNEVPLIEFVPPSRIKAEEITDKDVPKSHRFPSGPRLLRLELCLPGVDYHHSKYATPRFVHGYRCWFQCGERTNSVDRRTITRKLFALENCNAADKFSGYPISHPKKWTRASKFQQPRNGELWYRASASRLQVSVSLEYREQDDDSSDGSVTSSISTSSAETLSLLSTEWPANNQTKSGINDKYRTQLDCPHYYYWDSGLLAHKIDVERSQLVTEKNRIIFYLTLSVFRKNRRVWTDEELAALTQSLGYAHFPRAPKWIRPFQETSPKVYEKRSPALDVEGNGDKCEAKICEDTTIPNTIQVVLDRKPGQSLGLTLVEKSLHKYPDIQYAIPTGIFIKQLAPGGLAERSGQLKVHDQLIAINSVSVLPPGSHSIYYHSGSLAETSTKKTNHSEGEAESGGAQFTKNHFSNLNMTEARIQSVSGQYTARTIMMYPFAVRLLRQAIGPIHLTVKRMVPAENSCHQPEPEPESILVESEQVASVCDEVTPAQSEPQNTLPNEQVTSQTTLEPELTVNANETTPDASSEENSITSTRQACSPTEVSETVKPESTILVEEHEIQPEKSKVSANTTHEPESAISQCSTAGDRLDSRTDVFDTSDQPLNSSLPSTRDNIEPDFQRTGNPSPKANNPVKNSGTQRRLYTVPSKCPRTHKLNRTMPPSSTEFTQTMPASPDPQVKRHSRPEKTKRPCNPVPQLQSPVTSSQSQINSVNSQTTHLQTPCPKSPAVDPPSSGDQRLPCHMRRRQPSNEPIHARRRCKAGDPHSRRHGCHAEHNTVRGKSTNRLDSRLATLAKHIPQSCENTQTVQTQSSVIDADESRSFQALIASLNEAEWQALLQMVSQPDESYNSPRVRNRTKRMPHSTKQNTAEPKMHCRNHLRSGCEINRGDERPHVVHHGSHPRRRHY